MEATHVNIKDDAFLADTVWLSSELLNEILQQLHHLQTITPSSILSWNRVLTDLTQDISRFVELTSLLSRIAFKEHKALKNLVRDSHIHLLFVLKGINQAQQKQDLIALEELIKYELKDNLTQWKIDLIPQSKRLLNA